jgi:RNA polymerase sigma-70 factor (ECF subfamily)
MPTTMLNMAVVHMQMEDYGMAYDLLQQLKPADLEQRAYLYYGTFAEYYRQMDQKTEAISSLNKALEVVDNQTDREYLLKKKLAMT